MNCICTPTDPKSWTRHGDSVEPGSTLEPDPLCPEHFPEATEIVNVPSMWVVWLKDPSGKYGDHKGFYAHGEDAQEAEQVAIRARPGSTVSRESVLTAGPRRWRGVVGTGRVIEFLHPEGATSQEAP